MPQFPPQNSRPPLRPIRPPSTHTRAAALLAPPQRFPMQQVGRPPQGWVRWVGGLAVGCPAALQRNQRAAARPSGALGAGRDPKIRRLEPPGPCRGCAEEGRFVSWVGRGMRRGAAGTPIPPHRASGLGFAAQTARSAGTDTPLLMAQRATARRGKGLINC
jgi:hypothetical protein